MHSATLVWIVMHEVHVVKSNRREPSTLKSAGLCSDILFSDEAGRSSFPRTRYSSRSARECMRYDL